jgi:hypothetical protein
MPEEAKSLFKLAVPVAQFRRMDTAQPAVVQLCHKEVKPLSVSVLLPVFRISKIT